MTLGRIALLRLCSAQGRFVAAASLPHTDKRKSKRGEAVLTGEGGGGASSNNDKKKHDPLYYSCSMPDIIL